MLGAGALMANEAAQLHLHGALHGQRREREMPSTRADKDIKQLQIVISAKKEETDGWKIAEGYS